MLPPKRNSVSSPPGVGAPNEGARPPGAGGTGGASGDMPRPFGRGEPGRPSEGVAAAVGAAAAGVSAWTEDTIAPYASATTTAARWYLHCHRCMGPSQHLAVQTRSCHDVSRVFAGTETCLSKPLRSISKITVL